MSSRDKKPLKPSASGTGRIRTLSDLNRPSAGNDSDSDSDGPQEYYTGGEKRSAQLFSIFVNFNRILVVELAFLKFLAGCWLSWLWYLKFLEKEKAINSCWWLGFLIFLILCLGISFKSRLMLSITVKKGFRIVGFIKFLMLLIMVKNYTLLHCPGVVSFFFFFGFSCYICTFGAWLNNDMCWKKLLWLNGLLFFSFGYWFQ